MAPRKDQPRNDRQEKILEYIKSEVQRRGFPPSVREICDAMGIKSTSTVHGHLRRLENRGLLIRDPTKPRALEVVGMVHNTAQIPLVGKATAGLPITAIENIEEYLRKANALGIENILVSLGKDGAVLSNAQGIYKLEQPRTVLVNKVGAGDAMLASFIGKLSQGYSFEEALQWGGAAGNATASKLEDITLRDIEGYLLQMKVKKVMFLLY